MSRTIQAMVDSDAFAQVFTAQEVTEMCIEISSHILGLFESHYVGKTRETKILQKHDANIQLRLGVMGRVATEQIAPILVKTQVITIVTQVSYEFEESDLEIIEHKLDKKDMKHICPDTLVDFLLILLEETTKCIQNKLPKSKRYETFCIENLSTFRDIISSLRPLSKLPNVPARNLDTGIVSLSIKVEINQLVSN